MRDRNRNGLIVKGEGHYYYKNDRLHLEGQPAVEWSNGGKWWFINGKCHREDGPAIILANGYIAWYIHGQKIECETQEEFLRIVKMKAFL